jgi:hypothetical protein
MLPLRLHHSRACLTIQSAVSGTHHNPKRRLGHASQPEAPSRARITIRSAVSGMHHDQSGLSCDTAAIRDAMGEADESAHVGGGELGGDLIVSRCDLDGDLIVSR